MDVKLQKTGLDIEIKARCNNQEKIRKIITQRGAKYIGKFDMEDTYFNVTKGRLKARIGDIDDILIQYYREDTQNPKRSDFLVSIIDKESNIIPSLINALGVKVKVRKQREIYILDNLRFHVDLVDRIGKCIEMEARGENEQDLPKLHAQVEEFLNLFGIKKSDLIAGSYSDLIIDLNHKTD